VGKADRGIAQQRHQGADRGRAQSESGQNGRINNIGQRQHGKGPNRYNRRENTAKQRRAVGAPVARLAPSRTLPSGKASPSPQSARKFSVTPGCTNPRTCGPMRAPMPSSNTTLGSGKCGNSAGIPAATAIATATAIRLVMPTCSKRVLSRCGRSQWIQRRGRIQQARLAACHRRLLFQRSGCASMTPVRTAAFSAAWSRSAWSA
jgi:hypothetical protein